MKKLMALAGVIALFGIGLARAEEPATQKKEPPAASDTKKVVKKSKKMAKKAEPAAPEQKPAETAPATK